MSLKPSDFRIGVLVGAVLPFIAFAATYVTPVRLAATPTGAVDTISAPLAENLAPSDVFAQYHSPAPEVYELTTSAPRTLSTLTVEGAPVTASGPSSLSPVPSHIAADVEAGVANLNNALATAPVVLTKMTESIARNGLVAALAHDDPAVKAQTSLLGEQIAASLRGFAEAISKDMHRSIKESGIQQQSAGR